MRTTTNSFIHVDDPREPYGYTLQDVLLCGCVARNPYRNEPGEPAYIVQDIRIKTLCGQDITGAVESWEFDRLINTLVEAYQDAEERYHEARAEERAEALMLYGF